MSSLFVALVRWQRYRRAAALRLLARGPDRLRRVQRHVPRRAPRLHERMVARPGLTSSRHAVGHDSTSSAAFSALARS